MSFGWLCLTFMKFGILCIGGGYMLVPFLNNELVAQYGILTAEQFRNLFSVAQVTPGPIGINAATYVGFISYGVAGAVAVSVALVLPSLILTTLATFTLKRYESHWAVRGFLAGVRPATVGLIAGALLIFVGMSVFTGALPLDYPVRRWFDPAAVCAWPGVNRGALAIAAVAAVLQLRTKLTITWLILAAALLGAFIC